MNPLTGDQLQELEELRALAKDALDLVWHLRGARNVSGEDVKQLFDRAQELGL